MKNTPAQVKKEIGERIFYALKSLKITVSDFAKAVNNSSSNLYNYKRGKAEPPAEFYELVKKYNINPEWIRTGKGDMVEVLLDNKQKNSIFEQVPESEVDEIMEIGLLLTPQARCGDPIQFSDIPEVQTDLRTYVMPNVKRPKAIIARGESMLEDGIQDGDTVFYDPDAKPGNNQIILVILNGEPLIKRLKVDSDGIKWLVSSNENFKPIQINGGDNVQIVGVYKGIFRK